MFLLDKLGGGFNPSVKNSQIGSLPQVWVKIINETTTFKSLRPSLLNDIDWLQMSSGNKTFMTFDYWLMK